MSRVSAQNFGFQHGCFLPGFPDDHGKAAIRRGGGAGGASFGIEESRRFAGAADEQAGFALPGDHGAAGGRGDDGIAAVAERFLRRTGARKVERGVAPPDGDRLLRFGPPSRLSAR